MATFLALLLVPGVVWALSKFLLGVTLIPLIYQNAPIIFAIVGMALAIVLVKKVK